MSVAFTGGPGLTRVQVRSWLHMITEQWYRAIDVPSHPDRWVARLPYRVLKEDIEGRWEAYREAFRPLDELTSTVEAVAVLHAVRSSGNGPTWSAFAGSLRRGSSRLAPTRAGRLRPHPFEDNPWTVLSRAWVGDRVETPAEANLALALILAGEAGGARNRWLEGVAEVARLDPRTQAKWRLYETLVDVLAPGRQSSGAKVKALFDLLRRDFPASFRLRAQALNLLEAMTQVRERAGGERTDVEPPRWLRAAVARLRVESRSLLKDFQRRTGEPCSGRAKLGTFAWEGLSQDVYSVGLLSRARGEEGVLDPELTAAVACIHRNRGLADQVGRELAHRHAHYRFLGYLRKKAGTGTAKDELVRFRKELAARVGVPSD